MRITIGFLLTIVFYIALATLAFSSPSRLAVSFLVTTTFLFVAYGAVAGVFSRRHSRNFWAAFAIVGFGYQFLNHPNPPREFYSTPVVLSEFATSQISPYQEWHLNDRVPDNLISNPVDDPVWQLDANRNNAYRNRFRMIVHSIATVLFGCLAGFLGQSFVESDKKVKQRTQLIEKMASIQEKNK